MRRVAIIASASGNGKTTLGRELASRLGVPFVELDAIVHGPELDRDLRRRSQRRTSSRSWTRTGWVVDGAYQHKIGDLVVDAADTIVWLDLPLRVWLPRLLKRTYRRIQGTNASSTATASPGAPRSSAARR